MFYHTEFLEAFALKVSSKKQTQEKLHINEKRKTKTNYSTFPSFSQVVVKKCSGIEEFPEIW